MIVIQYMKLVKPIFCILALLFASVFAKASGVDSTAQVDSTFRLVQEMMQRSHEQRLVDSLRLSLLSLEIEHVKKGKSASQVAALDSQLNVIKLEDSLRLAAQKAKINQIRKSTQGYPVRLYQDTIYTIYTSLGSFSAQVRAAEAHARIVDLYDDPNFDPNALKIEAFYDLININYGDFTVTSIGTYDALWMDETPEVLAKNYLENIKFAIATNKESHTWQKIAIRWAKVLLILTIIIVLIRTVNYLIDKLVRYLDGNKHQILRDIRIHNYELLNKKYIFVMLVRTIKIAKILFVGLILYFGISFLLNVFPRTQSWTFQLWSWILDPLKEMGMGIIHYLPKLIKIAIIIVILRYVLFAIRYFSLEVEKGELRLKHFNPDWARTTYAIIRVILLAFALVLIFPNLPGSDTEAFKGVTVFAGILLSLGSSSAISNTIAGFVITYMSPYKVGDWIKVGDKVGKVIEKTALVTRIQTINQENVTIPNSTILTKDTLNYSANKQKDGLVITAAVTMGYSVPWRTIHEVLINAAQQTQHINKDKEPYVFQNTLDQFYVTYQINVYTHEPDKMFFIHTELLQNIQDGFAEAGIDMNLPTQISIKH